MPGDRTKGSLFIVLYDAEVSALGSQILVVTGRASVHYDRLDSAGNRKEFVLDAVKGGCIHYVNLSCAGSVLRDGSFLDTYMFFERECSERFITDFMDSLEVSELNFQVCSQCQRS